jgi:hypothetical protein
MMRWSKTALEARLHALSERHEGRELIDALVEFADSLEPEDRELFQQVLLERADAEQRHDYEELRERMEEVRWSLFRRRRRRGP